MIEVSSINRLIRRLLLTAAWLLVVSVSVAAAETVARATLGNGLQVVVVENPLAPMVTIHVNYLAGSIESPPGFPGTAHAVEHMMFRGSPGLTGDQVNAILAHVGGEANAFTEQAVTQYIATVPAADVEVMLHLEALRMKDILASEEQWRLERGAIEQEVAGDLSNPLYVLGTRLLEKLFADTPYAYDGLGSVASFEATSAAMLKQFHRSWYAPNNAILVIVGAVEPSRTVEMVKTLFGDIPARPLPARTPVKLKPLRAAELSVPSTEAYGLAVVAYRLPGTGDRDYAAGQVLAAALSSPRGKLYDLAGQQNVMGISFSSIPLPQASGGYVTAVVPVGEDQRQKARQLKKVLAEYVAEGIPAELVEAVKRHAATDAASDHDSIPGLADAWSEALAFEGYASPDEELAAINTVTVTDVNRVARTWLVNDTAITALLLPGSTGRPVVAAPSFKRTSEPFGPEAVKPVMLPAFARRAVTLPASTSQAIPPADLHLANGLRLIVRPCSSSKLVTVTGSIKSTPNLQTPAGKEGVAELLDQMMLQGTASLDRIRFQTALDEIGASVTRGTTFSLQVPVEHVDKGMSLLAEALLHPVFQEKAFLILREESAALLAGQKKSSEWVRRRAFLEALYPPGDPVLRYETPASVSSLTLRDVRAYHAAVFRPDLTTIVMTGNIDPSRARTIAERHFGAWRGEGPRPETDFSPIPDNRPVVIEVPDDTSQQSDVVLAQTLKLNRTHPDYYPLRLGMAILSGSTASRLYQSIRETRGLVYAVDAAFEVGKTRSLFTVTYGTDPKDVAKVRTLIERELDALLTSPVSQSELDLAKNTLLSQLAMSGASTAGMASLLLDLARDDLSLDLPAAAARQIRQVTAHQVQAAFKRWIRSGEFVQVTSGAVPEAVEKGHGRQ